MELYARGNKWWGRYKTHRFPTGEPVHAEGMSDKACREIAEKVFVKKVNDIVDGTYFDKRQEHKRTLGQLIERFMQDYGNRLKAAKNMYQKRDGKVSGYAARLFEGLGGADKRLNQITVEKVNDYKTQRLKDGLGPAGINRELGLLRQAWNHGATLKWCKKHTNPVSEAKLVKGEVKRRRYMLDSEEGRLQKACGDLWDRYTMLLHMGLRRSELVRMTWNDVDLTRRILTVPVSKNGKPREVPIDAQPLALFNRLLATRPCDPDGSFKTPLVFSNRNGKPLDPRALNRFMQRATKEAGINDLRPHDLRRTYGVRKLRSGYHMDQVQALLGHDDITTTQDHYSWHNTESLREPAARNLVQSTQATTVPREAVC